MGARPACRKTSGSNVFHLWGEPAQLINDVLVRLLGDMIADRLQDALLAQIKGRPARVHGPLDPALFFTLLRYSRE